MAEYESPIIKEEVNEKLPTENQATSQVLQQEEILKEPLYQEHELQLKQILTEANAFKQKGNQFFKEQKYTEAIAVYKEGITAAHPKQFQAIKGFDEIKFNIITILNLLQSNMAQCYMKLEQYEKVILLCDQVLYLDPNNMKSSYRKATAYKQLKQYGNSFEWIKKAHEIQKKNQQVTQELIKEYQEIKDLYSEEQKAQNEKEKLIYSKMLSQDTKVQAKYSNTIQDIMTKSLIFPTGIITSALVSKFALKEDLTSKKSSIIFATSLAASTAIFFFIAHPFRKALTN